MRSFVLLIVCLAAGSNLWAQVSRDEALADSYWMQGEFEKAGTLYNELWEKNNHPEKYYRSLFACYVKLSNWDVLEKLIRRQMRYQNDNPAYPVDLLHIFSLSNRLDERKNTEEKWIKNLPKNEWYLRQAGQYLEAYKMYSVANEIYEKAKTLLNDKSVFSWEIAVNLLRINEVSKGCNLLIQHLEVNPQRIEKVKTLLQDGNPVWMDEVERVLYPKIQKETDNPFFSELLIWIFIQRKDFSSALVQVKALDRRYRETGERLIELGFLAKDAKLYEEAAQAFEAVAAKGKDNPNYWTARTEQLNCRKESLQKLSSPTESDLRSLKSAYLLFIDESGKNAKNATLLRELAILQGLYLQETDSAIQLCEEILRIPGLSKSDRNKSKLALGDFYLTTEDPWNANLLYAQVDKDEQDSELGEEARYKNAYLSYVQGDFEWAQTQLQVLKSSTSELISNDAIQLSVFILDNSGLDTIFTPLEMYAKAELLLFQKKEEKALQLIDSIRFLFPGHVLWDDLNYLESLIRIRKKQYTVSIPLLEDILKNYKEDLRGDDAAFLLGEIYEFYLPDAAKAKTYYQQIIDQYPGSLLVLEARKRFRKLRGDQPVE